ncbi:glutaredoxin family protein [Microbacterium sp. LRZ72]|uniref:glutaredoxin family protein n=1 Tax=Microbacterium sp. LRZ72 TaxID=2942481 RepID=UPI0029B05225|nr:glutaredoxin family protein [Microbacterium sp. LRZ72]MDX2377755.1 glutaredoxin family protein [Microbacterium sp. LRZ72]
MPAVTVYSTGPSCQRCRLTIRKLEASGIRFTVIDITEAEHAAAREFLTDDLGYTEAPVVMVNGEPEHHWSGFRPDLIDHLAREDHTRPEMSPTAAVSGAGLRR